MSAVCPNGHTSDADDYCDTCGSPIDASAQPAPSGAGSTPGDPSAAPSGGAPATGSKSSLDLDPMPAPAGAAAGPAVTAATTLSCPNCQTENAEGALFCEACGYDFTTGAMPRDPSAPPEGEAGSSDDPAEGAAPSSTSDPATSDPADGPDAGASATPAAVSTGDPSTAASDFEWLAEVWIDPDWYQTQEAEDPCPSPGLPMIMPLRRGSVLLGRVSTSKNTNPEIDLSSDPGVSRRHAQLTTDGTRWFVEDLGSSNGTFVGPASGPLPVKAINVGPKTELDDDDRLYVGAWTRVVVRRATPDEVAAYA
ncbi:MAG: FHA domain-containing protein [Humibacillus sp.]|nr:FHA domain-containing protein [Humibacillus sp.]MDN5776719.1 FHA domain-containing protein [Humibacillus sp.]